MSASGKAALMLSLLAGGCGNGAGSDYNTSYATLHGTITASSVDTTSDVRVALVWEHINAQPGATSLKSTQELGLRATFPTNFLMDINKLPPAESLTRMDPTLAAQSGIDPNLRVAAGTLVVYEDTNRNGKLDLLPVDTKSTIDRVLGVPQGLTVLYVEGTPPPAGSRGYFSGVTLQRGFNLLQESGWQQTKPIDPTAATPWTVLPLSTAISISLTAAPQLSHYVCQKDPGLINQCLVTPPSDPSIPTPTLPPNCGTAPAAGSTPAPAPGTGGGAPAPGDLTPPCCKTTGDDPTPGSKPPPGNGSNGGTPGGVNGAGMTNCAPDGTSAPCSQSACMFNGTVVATPPSGGAGAGMSSPAPKP
ncbi:MAG TPA: hypothetical protein VFH73_17775 [Polyangia bacterium]|nr:hypothetical protein [Polyangia bacterium]